MKNEIDSNRFTFVHTSLANAVNNEANLICGYEGDSLTKKWRSKKR